MDNKTLKESEDRVMRLLANDILGVYDGKLGISGKFAFSMFQNEGVPPEILEGWVDRFIKTGRYIL